jgi:SAM-dependent methyltransferase
VVSDPNRTPQSAQVRPGYYGSAAARHIAGRTAADNADFFLGYLKPGMTLLDCGCGPGTITLGLAEVVTPGLVTGIDLDQQSIDSGRANAAQIGVTNVRFEVGDVYKLPFPDNSFDAAFEHYLFLHLRQPLAAMREILRVLKPGGAFGTRNPAHNRNIVGTTDPLVRRAERLWIRWGRHRLDAGTGGSNYRIGLRLSSLLIQAGFIEAEVSASFENLRPPLGAQWYGELMAERFERAGAGSIRDGATRMGWIDDESISQMAPAWRQWANSPDSYFAMANVGVVARKPS